MKKKQKDLFNTLMELPELKEQKSQKIIRQLQSACNEVGPDFVYVSYRSLKHITKYCDILQSKLSDESLIQELNKIKSKCHSNYSQQKREESGLDYDPYTSWCSEDD